MSEWKEILEVGTFSSDWGEERTKELFDLIEEAIDESVYVHRKEVAKGHVLAEYRVTVECKLHAGCNYPVG